MTVITRIPGSVPTRSRAVVHNGIVHTVAVSPDKTPSVYEQTQGALALIERSLREAGSDKTGVLTAIVYLTDMSQKEAMNRAWDEWVDPAHKPARMTVEAPLVDPRWKVEITGVALAP